MCYVCLLVCLVPGTQNASWAAGASWLLVVHGGPPRPLQTWHTDGGLSYQTPSPCPAASCPALPHSDLAQHGVVLVVTGARPSIRPLLLAHGVPLPPAPLHWPPEVEPPVAAAVQPSVRGSRAGSPRAHVANAVVAGPPAGTAAPSASTGSLAAEQPWEDQHWPVAGEEELHLSTCLEFGSLEEGLR